MNKLTMYLSSIILVFTLSLNNSDAKKLEPIEIKMEIKELIKHRAKMFDVKCFKKRHKLYKWSCIGVKKEAGLKVGLCYYSYYIFSVDLSNEPKNVEKTGNSTQKKC